MWSRIRIPPAGAVVKASDRLISYARRHRDLVEARGCADIPAGRRCLAPEVTLYWRRCGTPRRPRPLPSSAPPAAAPVGCRASTSRGAACELERHTRSGHVLRRGGAAVRGLRLREPRDGGLGLPAQAGGRLQAGLPARGLPARDRRARRSRRGIDVRPEATTFTYSHAGFTVRQIIFAPVDEPAIVMLLDVRQRAAPDRGRLLPPAAEADVAGGADDGRRGLGREGAGLQHHRGEQALRGGHRLARARATSRSCPTRRSRATCRVRFLVDVPPDRMRTHLVPIVIAGSVEGRDKAMATYDRLLASARALYEKNVAHYRAPAGAHGAVDTPDARLDTAFALGQGGHGQGPGHQPAARHRPPGRASGPRGRASGPGSPGCSAATRSGPRSPSTPTATSPPRARRSTSCASYQRDGRQDPARDLPERVARALVHGLRVPLGLRRRDAALRDRCRPTTGARRGDREFLRASLGLDREGLAVLRGHGHATATASSRTRSSATAGRRAARPIRPHEEIYLQGVWIEACAALAELADANGRRALAGAARAAAERTAGRGGEDVLAGRPRVLRVRHRAGRSRRRSTTRSRGRGARRGRPASRRCAASTLVDEDTVLPAVPLWWRTLDAERAQSQIDHLGRAALATDWGHRLLSDAERALRPALLPLRLGVAAVHGLGLDGRVSLRPAPRRLPGAHGQRAADLPGRARLRDGAAVRRLQRARSAARRTTRSGRRRWW